ncbi:unnamed protein product [Protopolystoma xenopodis]|uniref:nicotinate phosphoribosyltransferase n=1 Tax=Protopolystoma xenopodis TaxID=117903 RepID=A0A3S4ZZJ0_9PLAT|nr:unnamed protein product [Protopolystoma xenopodis]
MRLDTKEQSSWHIGQQFLADASQLCTNELYAIFNFLSSISLSRLRLRTCMHIRLHFVLLHVGVAILDILMRQDESPPKVDERILCRHPFHNTKRVHVVPSSVEPLQHLFWQGGKVSPLPTSNFTCLRYEHNEVF